MPAAAVVSPSSASPHPPQLTVGAPPPSTLPMVRSATTDVYNLPELRYRILRLLPRKDLIRFLRVDKRNFLEVAREVHRMVDYEDLWKLSRVAPERQSLYSEAVSEVRIRSGLNLPKSVQRQLGVKKYDLDYRDKYAPFSQVILRFIVSKIRDQFGRVRRIQFQDYGEGEGKYWAVTFDSDRGGQVAAGPPGNIYWGPPEDSGSICHYERLSFSLYSPPPKTTNPPPPSPSSRYTVKRRVEFHISSSSLDKSPRPLFVDEWLAAIRTHPMFNELHRSVCILEIPVTLADLSDLYRRQTKYGHRQRLESVSATHIVPYDIYELESFARIASTSLTDLHLGSQDDPHPERARLSFADLPALCRIVRYTLPNLIALRLDLKGISTAEALCGSWLTGESLSETGNLFALDIFLENHPTPMYNILRYLYSILAAGEPYVCLNVEPHQAPRWVAEEQSGFIQFLQGHPSHLRAKLATVDFSSLGITSLEEVPELLFDEDDNLLNLADSRAARPPSPGSWSPSQCECGHSDCGSSYDCCTANPADYETYGNSSPARYRYEDYDQGYMDDSEED